MAQVEYRILKNMPSQNSYWQYYWNYNTELFFSGTGVDTPLKNDDLYSIIVEEGEYGASADNEWIFEDFRPISNIFVGNDPETGIYVQKYYEFDDPDYLMTSAPNIVNLYFDIARNDNSFLINYENFYTLLEEALPADWAEYANSSVDLDIYVRVLNWDWKEGDYDFDTQWTYGYIDPEDGNLLYEDDNVTPRLFSHQYNSPGLKHIKVIVFAKDSLTNNAAYKYVDIKINLGLDSIYIEDFVDLGGPDFNLLPWPVTSPIVGGISQKSDYIKSLKKIIKSNYFGTDELYEKYFAEKASKNTELGNSLGDVDFQQVRVFNRGWYDMSALLGIRSGLVIDEYNFKPYYDIYDEEINPTGYWGTENTFFNSEESSIGTIFITDTNFSEMNNCIIELNAGELNISSIIDSSGNGISGILIGDYNMTKYSKGVPITRDSVMKISEIEYENGAL